MEYKKALRTARTVSEVLPYIQRFADKLLVIKYGGNAMTQAALRTSFARDVVLLKTVGMHPIVVHGGGPQINHWLRRCGLQSHFHKGLRITDATTMEVVEMVLGGKVNKEIVTEINLQGGSALGLSGRDGGLLHARRLSGDVDLGQVGELVDCNVALLNELTRSRYIPVIAPIGVDHQGTVYNINADNVAAWLAQALGVEKLIFLTNAAGVLDASGALINRIVVQKMDSLIASGAISGGMLPKLHAAREAIHKGVSSVHIINGQLRHALLLEVFTDSGIGSLVTG